MSEMFVVVGVGLAFDYILSTIMDV